MPSIWHASRLAEITYIQVARVYSLGDWTIICRILASSPKQPRQIAYRWWFTISAGDQNLMICCLTIKSLVIIAISHNNTNSIKKVIIFHG